jgi:hypothetical protein
MVVQETELISVGAAWDVAKHGHHHLEVECQKLRSTCSSESSVILRCISILSLCLVMNQLSHFRVVHEGALRSGREGGCEPEGVGYGQLVGSTDCLHTGSLQCHAQRRPRECPGGASPSRGSSPSGFPNF